LCRTRRDIGDARQFVLAIAYLLNDYSDQIIQEVSDPKTGLPGSLRYPLEIADVKRACEAAKMARDSEEWNRGEGERQEQAARIAAQADAMARERIVDEIGARGHNGEAVFQFMESYLPQNVRWFLDRYRAGKSINIGLSELIEDWQKAGSPAPSRAA
jgi:hypothetical protein